MVKIDKFNFLKIKMLLKPMQTCYFWLSSKQGVPWV